MAAPLIAVVNHEPIYLRLMAELLEKAEYRTLTIQDGGLAYELIKRELPDLIIVDTWLGTRHEGLDLLQLLKLDELTSTIPVLVVSSDDQKTVTDKLANPPRDDIGLIFKPFDPEPLLDAVNDLLRRHHA